LNTIILTTVRHRWARLASAVVAAWALLLVPLVVTAPAPESAAVAVAQFVISGTILGIGKQGIDLLLLRLFAAATGLLTGTLFGQLKHAPVSVCSGPLDCVQALLLGVLGFGLFGTVVLALVSVPVTVLWNRGFASLRPELHWPAPRTWWQWLVLILGIVVVVFALSLVLGVPWPA
jgi:hypothetical protein